MTASGIGEGCEPMRLSLGAFVLGALSAEESREVRRHLAGCPDCRREHQEMEGMPSVLGLLSRAEAEAVDDPLVKAILEMFPGSKVTVKSAPETIPDEAYEDVFLEEREDE